MIRLVNLGFQVFGAVALTALFSIWLCKRKAHHKLYPPGPWTRTIPFIGSAISFDFASPYLAYTKWAKTYGDIVHTRILGDHVVVLSNETKLKGLTEGSRSAVYASRLHFHLFKRFGVDFHTAMIPYGSEWRQHRVLLHQAMHPEVIEDHKELFMDKAKSLVLLLDKIIPENLAESLKQFAAAVALEFTYGYKAQHDDVVINATLEHASSSLVGRMSPEMASLIHKFPIFDYIPGFMLGMSSGQKLVSMVKDIPYETLKQNLGSASEKRSAMDTVLRSQEESKARASELTLKNVAATIYISAIDNIAATLQTFLLTMFMFPEKQKRAQEELDRVVGPDRLPAFEDRPTLPYIEAIISECFRWHPTSPAGVAHYTTEDDIFEDYYIPKGSLVRFNTWAVSRACKDPESFEPERHLLPDGEVSPESRISSGFLYGNFGFGRRVCPGRVYADNMLWACVVQIVATLTISGKGSEQVKENNASDPRYEGSFTARPKVFQHNITIRSRGREALLREPIR
ncbi:cytochrome P450 [Butyriboletus roseoflavus]|nr:cytochrome P450 [Butyriboletus roseoflavus]